MGVLVVHCPNRPEDEIIDCGVYGMRLNMHSHNVDDIKGEIVVGVPVSGKKLPSSGKDDDAQIAAMRSQSAGAVIDTETPGGIHSTDLPGGVISTPETPEPSPVDKQKAPQAKTGGE